MPNVVHIAFGTPLKPVKVNARSARLFRNALQDAIAKKPKRLIVSFTTSGGFCEDGFPMYHSLLQVAETIELHTHAVMECSSMGALIYLAGDIRTYSPGTVMGIHAASRDEDVCPTYNGLLMEVYKDRVNLSQADCDRMFATTDMTEPTSEELYAMDIYTHLDPSHVIFKDADYTIQ